MAAWLVAVFHWGRERFVRDDLTEQGFASYFPKYLERCVVKGRKTFVEKNLFGRYFFVETSERWRKLFSTQGIDEIFVNNTGEKPILVKEEIIHEIRSREVKGFVPMLTKPRMTKGDKVRVISGPFVDKIGIYEGMGRRNREVALLEFLGSVARVEVSSGNLMRVVDYEFS